MNTEDIAASIDELRRTGGAAVEAGFEVYNLVNQWADKVVAFRHDFDSTFGEAVTAIGIQNHDSRAQVRIYDGIYDGMLDSSGWLAVEALIEAIGARFAQVTPAIGEYDPDEPDPQSAHARATGYAENAFHEAGQ